MANVAINGLGRIGRAALKILLATEGLELVAVNDIADADNLAYLLKYDTAYGRYHTGAAQATTRAVPELAGRFDGIAVRAPIPVGRSPTSCSSPADLLPPRRSTTPSATRPSPPATTASSASPRTRSCPLTSSATHAPP